MRVGKREISVLELIGEKNLDWREFIETIYQMGLDYTVVQRIVEKGLIILSNYKVSLSTQGYRALEKARKNQKRKFIDL